MKKLLIFSTILALSLAACQQKSTGCLDPEAINFAVEVDKSCDSCCQYPLMQINIAPIWGDENTKFNYQKTWTDANGKPFKIDTIAFYLTDFQLINSSTNTVAPIMDSVRMRVFPDSLGGFIQRNLLLVRPTTETYNVGTLLAKGEFDRLSFKIGLNDAQNKVIPARAPGGHALRLQPETMWDETDRSFFFWKIKWRKDTLAGTPQSVLQWPASLKTRSVLLDFAEKTTWKRGISPVMVLWLDYSKWFDGVDLTEPDAVILAKMMDNLPGSFVLKKP